MGPPSQLVGDHPPPLPPAGSILILPPPCVAITGANGGMPCYRSAGRPDQKAYWSHSFWHTRCGASWRGWCWYPMWPITHTPNHEYLHITSQMTPNPLGYRDGICPEHQYLTGHTHPIRGRQSNGPRRTRRARTYCSTHNTTTMTNTGHFGPTKTSRNVSPCMNGKQ